MLGWFKTLSIGIQIAVVLGVMAIIAGAIWSVYHSIYVSGYRDAEAKLKPQIQKLEQDLKNSQSDLDSAAKVNKTFSDENKRLADLARSQSLELDKLEAAKITAQNAARAALARVADNQKRYTAEIARLQAIVNGPPMTEGDCEKADSILRSILRDRMSISTGAAEAFGNQSASAGRDGEGSGGAAVHQQGGFASTAAANQDRFENGQYDAAGSSCWTRLAGAG